MIFLFFYWANRAKRCAVRNNTNLLSTLWPSAEVEPRSGFDDSLASGWRLPCVFWTFIYTFLFLSPLTGGCTAGEMDETFSRATQDLGSVQMPVHQLPLFVMLLETKVWFPKLMQPALEFSNSCGSRCAGGGVGPGKTEEQLGQAAGFFHDLSDKTQPSYFCCFAEQCFFFSADIPQLKLLGQTERKETFFQMQFDVQHDLEFSGFIRSDLDPQRVCCSFLLQPLNSGEGISLCRCCANTHLAAHHSVILSMLFSNMKSVAIRAVWLHFLIHSLILFPTSIYHLV